jgi:diaminopimelate epimerase
MCGNGLRCAARFAVDNKLVDPGVFNVRTDAGVLKAKWDGKDASNIEVQVGKTKINHNPLTLFDRIFYKADVGNPHAVTFVENTRTAPVQEIGPKVESNSEFPNKTNVEFCPSSKSTCHTSTYLGTWFWRNTGLRNWNGGCC